mgnify:CR=1 FL=1
MTEIAGRSVAGDEGHVIAERPQLLRDGIEQLLVIAAREIGATNRSLKQHIAHNRKL